MVKLFIIFVLNNITTLCQIVGDHCSVLVVERNRSGVSWIILDIKKVEEMNSFLLNVIVTPECLVNPFETGGMTDDTVVVSLRHTFTNN